MRIAIHAGTLRGAGSSNVGRALIAALQRKDEHQFVTWVPKEWSLPRSPLTRTHVTSSGIRSKFSLELAELPMRIRRGEWEVLLSLGDTSSPRVAVPHVLFVQQAYLAYSASAWGFRPNPSFGAKMHIMSAYFRMGLSNVQRFVVQTQDMRAKLIDRWSLESDRVVVIPSSVGSDVLDFQPLRVETAPYMLYVAGPAPHKNHQILPRVLAAMVRKDVKIQITVNPGALPGLDRMASTLGVQDRLEYLGPLGRVAMLNALASATAAIIPSELESFGLGYYEAMALGVPVIAADRAFAREACGNAALYAPPQDADALAAHADTVSASATFQAHMGRQSRARFEKVHLGWDEIASRFISTLEDVL